MANQEKGILISNFNIDNFAGCLDNDGDYPMAKSIIAPFGQVTQALLDEKMGCWRENPDFAVVWITPESISGSFNHMLNYRNTPVKSLLKEVDEYSSLLLNICHRVKFAFIPTWVLPTYNRGLGMLDMKVNTGIANALMRMNLRLSENLEKIPNIYLLNTQKWVEVAGTEAFNPKLWYMGKIAFGNEVFREAVKDIKSALRGIRGEAKKLIILDLDDTLWGGIAGDIGIENIKLGGHDYIGEAYVDFQRALKSLANRGILLAIVSKNEESTALEIIEEHPEMALRLNDFAGWKINWQDKARNIIELVSELNLGLQSVIFIDDSPVERARVQEALPEVFVPEWPQDPMSYKSALLGLRCFDMPSLSSEDYERAKMYALERQRKDLKKKINSVDEWLESLGIKIEIESLNKANLQRAAQLFNKTNQMNLTTRRMTEPELMNWVREDKRKLWTFRVGDRFGDSGLTGITSLEVQDKKGKIVDFILSCRVIGRKAEEAMLYTAIKYAKSLGLDEVYTEYIPTAKNKPCLRFFESCGFKNKNNLFIWELNKDYKIPSYIQISE